MFAKIVLGLVVAALSNLPAAASAAETPEHPLGLAVTIDEGEVLWVEATVDSGTSPVELKIMTPRRDGSRRLFQRCSFSAAGAGTYRCGLDVAGGSIAASFDGNWAVRAVVDRSVVGRLKFSIPK